MRFYFDIDDGIFEDEFGIDFRKTIKDEVISTISENVIINITEGTYYSECCEMIKQIIKEKTPEIIERVVDKVAEQVARKKAIIEMTPKASEFAAIDKDNVAYFEEMIDKAIARRFGKTKD